MWFCNCPQGDADAFIEVAKQLQESAKVETMNEELLRIFSSCCAGNICPMQAVIGGIAAQEVMKVCASFCVYARALFLIIIRARRQYWSYLLITQYVACLRVSLDVFHVIIIIIQIVILIICNVLWWSHDGVCYNNELYIFIIIFPLYIYASSNFILF